MRPSKGIVPSIKDVFLSCNPERPTSRPSLPSSLFISLRLCQDLDHKHPSAQRYSLVLSQTYRRSTEGQRGQAATDSLNDHSILPGAKVMEMGASRTRQVLRCRASSHLNKKKKSLTILKISNSEYDTLGLQLLSSCSRLRMIPAYVHLCSPPLFSGIIRLRRPGWRQQC